MTPHMKQERRHSSGPKDHHLHDLFMDNRLLLGISIIAVIALIDYLYGDSLLYLVNIWLGSEDFSHGIAIPFVSVFLIWQARHHIVAIGIRSSWWGFVFVAGGLFLFLLGELATLYVIQHLSLWIIIVGLAVSLIGIPGAKAIAFPLAYLLTSIPLPVFISAPLSNQLQLWSSTLGVKCLQVVGVMAFRDGNVIDLGPVQLQVVEACSGIRYLFPLVSLALLCAYFFKDRMWKRVLLVLSSLPISILVNGFRIGMIGVLVEWHGQGAAEGFYHLFEGWALFMASLGLLILEMWVLRNLGTDGMGPSFSNLFTWTDRISPASNRSSSDSTLTAAGTPSAYLCSIVLFIPVAFASNFVVEREEVAPPRAIFIDFPMQVDGWVGQSITLEKQYIDALRFDDYMLADYQLANGQPVNLYAAYYRSQRKGQSAHSPKSCLPGGGWDISSFETMEFPIDTEIPHRQSVNRAVIQRDKQKQVVMYWFKQRDRLLTNEYLVKFYLFWDALLRGRTDGALVRIASPVGPGETEDIVDQRLMQFVSAIEPELTRFVPD